MWRLSRIHKAGSPTQPGRSETGKSENWERPLGGTDFVIARTGGDFNVPIRKAAWGGLKNKRQGDSDECNQQH